MATFYISYGPTRQEFADSEKAQSDAGRFPVEATATWFPSKDDEFIGVRTWSDTPGGVSAIGSGRYGEVSVSSNSTSTVIQIKNTPVKVAGTTTNGPVSDDIIQSSGRLTFTGAVGRSFQIIGSLNALKSTGGGTDDFTIYIAINGVSIGKSEIKVNLGSDEVPASIQCSHDLGENDYAEIWIENNDGTSNVLVGNYNLSLFTID